MGTLWKVFTKALSGILFQCKFPKRFMHRYFEQLLGVALIYTGLTGPNSTGNLQVINVSEYVARWTVLISEANPNQHTRQ